MVAREQTSYLKSFPILVLRILQHSFIINITVIVTHLLDPSLILVFKKLTWMYDFQQVAHPTLNLQQVARKFLG